jgi:hypothetical protein
MTLSEALSDMDRLSASWSASPPEIQCLVRFALNTIDRELAAMRNPTLSAMLDAVPNSLMASIVADQRRGVSSPSSLASTPDAPKKGTGWVETSFQDRTNQFELMDRIVASQVGGPNNARRF